MIREALDAHAKATEKVWAHDRTQSIGASEIGSCARRLWFLKHDQAPDPDYKDRWGAKRRGDLIEAFWVNAVRRYFGKGVVHYAGHRQKTLIDPQSRLSATPDGLVVDRERNRCFTIECKTIDPRVKFEEAKPEHVFQMQVQLGLFRELTRYKPDYGILAYIDASFIDELREFRIDFAPEIYEQAKIRAHTIFAANQADALRPEGVIAGGSECEICAFRHTCSLMRSGAVPKAEDNRLEEAAMRQMAGLARKRASMKRSIETLETGVKDCEEDIKEALRTAGTRRAEGHGVRISWSALKGRPSWDWPGLRAAAAEVGLDLAPFERTGEPSDRLDIRFKQPVAEAAK